MRLLQGLLVLVMIMNVNGCSPSPKAHCEEAVEHMTKIVSNDPTLWLVPQQQRATMVAGLQARQPENVTKCVQDYNVERINCILATKEKSEIMKCDKIGR